MFVIVSGAPTAKRHVGPQRNERSGRDPSHAETLDSRRDRAQVPRHGVDAMTTETRLEMAEYRFVGTRRHPLRLPARRTQHNVDRERRTISAERPIGIQTTPGKLAAT